VARRGVFGRLPRAAPDLTNTLVALIREANAQEDQNMVDAWKNGGKVEGKGVDDDRLLEHMKKRRDALSPDDPLWDEWNNNYIQYDFSIHESKMALKNDQGKVSDAEMASFYRKWAGREDVQQDSEFYRTLMSSAAKWAEAAKGRSAGRGAANAAAAHQKWVNGYYKEHVQGSETANAYLLVIAQTYGAAPPGANNLADINQNSDAYHKFMDVISDGKADGNPAVQGLIDEMNAEIKKTNPNWKFTEGNLADLLDRGDKGLHRLGKESTSETEKKGWAGRREDLRFDKARIKQTKANEAVQVAADTFVEDMEDCAGDPYCATNVTKKFRDTLVREQKNIIGGVGSNIGGLAPSTQDVKTASALVNTLGQLDAALKGENVLTPAAAAGVTSGGKAVYLGDGEPPPGYTVFDAAAGNDSPRGYLAGVSNLAKMDRDRLDRGGYVMTEPAVGAGGAPILDGLGRPTYTYNVYDPNTPPTPGAIAVTGTKTMVDTTRVTTGPAAGPTGTGPTTRTPIVYVVPSEPNVAFEDPLTRTSVAPKPGEVKMFEGTAEVSLPWQELRGVRGPDGVARTIYRTSDGKGGFLFHENAPVPPDGLPNSVKKNAAGQYVIPVTTAQDEKGNSFLKADVSGLMIGVKSAQTQLKSGNYVFGTYRSAGAAQTSKAIADLYSNKDPKAAETADKYFTQYRQGLESLPLNDPTRIAGMSDLNSLGQTVNAYKTGKAGTTVGAAYKEANAYDPKMQGYVDTLNKAGFTAGRYGQDEFDRRVTLLAGINEADQRIANRPAVMSGGGGYGGYWGMATGGRGIGSDPRNVAERALLEQQKRDVLNPTISVSNIKVPGMPGMTQAAGAGQAVNPLAPGWMGQMGQVPGVGLPAPTTKYTPPSKMQGPSTTGQPMGGNLPTAGLPGPTTVKPPSRAEKDDVITPPVKTPAAATLPGIPTTAKKDRYGSAYEMINGRKVYY